VSTSSGSNSSNQNSSSSSSSSGGGGFSWNAAGRIGAASAGLGGALLSGFGDPSRVKVEYRQPPHTRAAAGLLADTGVSAITAYKLPEYVRRQINNRSGMAAQATSDAVQQLTSKVPSTATALTLTNVDQAIKKTMTQAALDNLGQGNNAVSLFDKLAVRFATIGRNSAQSVSSGGGASAYNAIPGALTTANAMYTWYAQDQYQKEMEKLLRQPTTATTATTTAPQSPPAPDIQAIG